jgi:hypothetical protein
MRCQLTNATNARKPQRIVAVSLVYVSRSPDHGLMATENDDRTAWDRAWASMPHRRLVEPPKIDVAGSLASGFGEVVSVTISEDPPEYSDKPGRHSEICPVCGAPTDGTKRLPASLHPTLANGFTYGLCVWVHSACFESCPDAKEPTPIPW